MKSNKKKNDFFDLTPEEQHKRLLDSIHDFTDLHEQMEWQMKQDGTWEDFKAFMKKLAKE